MAEPADDAIVTGADELDPAGGGRPRDPWDAFVAACPGADLVQSTAWGAAKAALGMSVRRAVVSDAHGTVGGGQILVKRLGPGVAVGSVPRGPLLRRDAPAGAARTVVEAVLAEARRAGVRFVIVQAPEDQPEVEAALIARGFEDGCPSVAPDATIRLDLGQGDDALMAAMHRMRRRNVTRAAPPELEIALDEDVDTFARLHAATAARQGFAPLDGATLRAQWGALRPVGGCALMMARFRGVPLSGLWLGIFAGTVTFRLAGWDAGAAERLGAPRNMNSLLHWTAIRWARAHGAHRFDLGGIDRRVAAAELAGEPVSDAMRTTPAFFKLAFGGTPVLLPTARWALTGRVPAALGTPVVRRLLAHPRATALMARARNG